MMPIEHAIRWMYPYTVLLGHEGKMAVEGVLKVSICCPSSPSSSFHFLPTVLFFLSPLIFPYLSFFFIIPSLPFQDRKHMMPITRKQWWEVWVWLGDLLYGANKQIELSQGMGMFIVVGVRPLTVGERSQTRQEDDTRGP